MKLLIYFATETNYAPEHFALFLASPDETELQRTGRQTFKQISRPKPQHGFHLSNVLVAHLSIFSGGDGEIDWHQIVTKPFPSSGRQLRDSLQAAIDIGFVRYVMDIIPNNWPDFLPEGKRPVRPEAT